MSIYCNPRRQRGDILLESLIGVLIAALAAGGIAHLLGRINDSQREAKVEQLALRQMRDDLHDKGLALCGTTPTLSLPGNLTPATIDKTGSMPRNSLLARHLREFPNPPNVDAGEGVRDDDRDPLFLQ